MITIYTEFGKEVKHQLIEKGMTEKELANQLGIGQPYLTNILKGVKQGSKHISSIRYILDMDDKNNQSNKEWK